MMGGKRRIDSPMCFKRGSVLYPGPDDAEGGLGQIKESRYVKDADEKIVREAVTIQFEDAGKI